MMGVSQFIKDRERKGITKTTKAVERGRYGRDYYLFDNSSDEGTVSPSSEVRVSVN